VLSLPAGKEFKKALLNMPKLALAYQKLEPSIIIDTNTNPQVEEVRVDMAAMKVESRPVELLTSVGSCVAICLHDSKHKCGGLAHIMLPYSTMGPQEPLPPKFADTAVPALIKALSQIRGNDSRLTAKIAGGANMFANLGANRLDIGAKNVNAVKTTLGNYNIRLLSEDVGGSHGRKITFNTASGIVVVRHFNGDVKTI
jgi:chemotaxis protein CheD